MMNHKTRNSRKIGIAFLYFAFAFLLWGCYTAGSTAPTCPEVTCPDLECPEPARYEDSWARSAHADQKAEAFNYWDSEDPPEIPIECAKCHSKTGFIDFLGIDGSTFLKTDTPAEIGTTVTCYVCHNEVIDDLTSVVFSSGVKIRELGVEVRCIQCHQGRASTKSVNDVIEGLSLKSPDSSSDELMFVNSHAASAAIPFGSEVKGGYEYDGRIYKERYIRGEEFFSCERCHDAHTLEIKVESCGECHTFDGINPENIRVDTTDFDGDGDTLEGIAQEIKTLQESLLETMKVYVQTNLGLSFGIEPMTYPYFFFDTNDDGNIDSQEAVIENQFLPWTPRLLKAAYNYNLISRDPGAYTHNSDYTLQLLYDSIDDLGGDISSYVRP